MALPLIYNDKTEAVGAAARADIAAELGVDPARLSADCYQNPYTGGYAIHVAFLGGDARPAGHPRPTGEQVYACDAAGQRWIEAWHEREQAAARGEAVSQ